MSASITTKLDALTQPEDIVLDIFAGSNTTGAGEFTQRRWIAFEQNLSYLFAFRFIEEGKYW